MRMRFDGHDFTLLGTALALGGAILLAKAYLMPSYPIETASTYFNRNPFQIRNSIITRHEAIAGVIWLTATAIIYVIGIVRTVRYQKQSYLVSSWVDIFVLCAVIFVLWRLTLGITYYTSRTEYVPILSESLREMYSRDVHVLNHSGQYRQERLSGIVPSRDVTEQRLRQATEGLNNIGKLLDEPRLPNEDDKQYALRLASYFTGIGPD